jgi:endonuclease/exonuclease/phosphatase (EEP) superfamily protein YafD
MARRLSITAELGLAASLLLGGAGVGLIAGEWADAAPATQLILFLEPLAWVGLAVVAGHGLMRRHWMVAAGAIMSLVAFAGAIRRPPVASEPPRSMQGPSPTVRTCATHAKAPTAGVRVVTWVGQGPRDRDAALDRLLSLDADVYVLQDQANDTLSRSLADALVDHLLDAHNDLAQVTTSRELSAGELQELTGHLDENTAVSASPLVETPYAPNVGWVFSPDDEGGVGVVVREGFFGVCGSEQEELWQVEGTNAHAVLAFPILDDVGLFPLIAVQADRSGSPGSWQVHELGQLVARQAQALGAPSLVVAGDFGAHSTLRGFHGSMLSVGLSPNAQRSTWPAQIAGLPALPLYQSDAVWSGPSWIPTTTAHVRLPGSDHLAVVADLEPRPE